MDASVEPFRRYAALIESIPGIATPLAAEDDRRVQVERGDRLSGAAAADPFDRLVELARSGSLAAVSVVDVGGHGRAVYRPLLVFRWLEQFSQRYETLPRQQFGRWEEALRIWCEDLQERLPTESGEDADAVSMAALALHVAGKLLIRDAWTDLASDYFGRWTRAQRSDGAFLVARPSDSPEGWWYEELVILHAAAGYAVRAEDRAVAAAVARATAYHLAETQSDHATSEPWGLFGFIWNPPTRAVADQMLHTLSLHHPGGVGGVPLMLLDDALYSLRLFL